MGGDRPIRRMPVPRPTLRLTPSNRIGSRSKFEENFMRRILIPSIGLAMFCAASSFAQMKASIQNVPEIPFTSVPNFLKTPASGILGESVAVATNSKGHVFVFHRSANTRLFEYDANGNFLKEIGVGYYGFEFA